MTASDPITVDLHRIVSTVTHELSGHLAPIFGWLFHLEHTGSLDDTQRDLISQTEHQLRLLSRIIQDLRDLAAPNGQLQVRPRGVLLCDIMLRSVNLVQQDSNRRNHRLMIRYPTHPIWVNADASRLEQVFVNLLTNAIKYTPDRGDISIVASDECNEIVVRVTDNGPGIPADLATRVFEMFVQGDHNLERRMGGLGIGLTLVKFLVEAHSGTVDYEPNPTGGSVFTVRLPRVSQPKDHHDPDPTLVNSRRILIVDDNELAASSLSQVLLRHGHIVAYRTDGSLAIEAIPTFRPDMILVDIEMPGLDGYDTSAIIHDSYPNVRVSVLSGYGPDDDDRERQCGIDRHFVKPVEMDLLHRYIAQEVPVATYPPGSTNP
jgi:CheY-like chemotaxis protein